MWDIILHKATVLESNLWQLNKSVFFFLLEVLRLLPELLPTLSLLSTQLVFVVVCISWCSRASTICAKNFPPKRTIVRYFVLLLFQHMAMILLRFLLTISHSLLSIALGPKFWSIPSVITV